MFDGLKKRLAEVRRAPEETALRAAPRIQAKLRQDATTKRGNVPSYGELGNVPIRVEARAQAIVVTAPNWVHDKARELKQPDAWVEIVAEEGGRVLRGEK